MSLPSTQKVILIEETGDVDVLQYKDFPVPQISSPTEVIIRNKYSGINYIELYFRQGIYPLQKPYVLGREASGVVAAVGSDVKSLKVGDRVSYLLGATFAQYTKIEESKNIYKLPDDILEEDFKVMGSILTQGLTALTFAELAYDIKKDDFILIYAAAGGVGQILVQLVLSKGAHPIAIASSDEKLNIVKGFGAKLVINSSKEDIVTKVKEFTNGNGVQCAFDSVGKDTYETTLETLATNGRFVSYGNATGKIPPISINTLPKNIAISRPMLYAYIPTKPEFEKYMLLLYKLYKSGEVKFNIFKTFPLADYKLAAKLLESRATTGKLTLEIPQ